MVNFVLDVVKNYLGVYWRGLIDAISLHKTFKFFLKKIVRGRVVQCIVLNGTIFIGSILFFDHIVSPILTYILVNDPLQLISTSGKNSSRIITPPYANEKITHYTSHDSRRTPYYSEELVSESLSNTKKNTSRRKEGADANNDLQSRKDNDHLESERDTVSQSEGAKNTDTGDPPESLVKMESEDKWSQKTNGARMETKMESSYLTQDSILALFSILYKILWLYPIYCISFVLNAVTYQEIADACQSAQTYRDKPKKLGFHRQLVNEVHRILSTGVYLTLLQACYFFVPGGKFVYLIGSAWIASLYCFEYRWVHLGWSSQQRLSFFERHWLYFFGFGSPIGFASFFSPTFLDHGIFALVFPLFLLTSAVASPVPLNKDARFRKLPIFQPVLYLTTTLLSIFDRKRRKWVEQKNRELD